MMATERVDCVVIGAGVVGLATALALALAGREVIVLEAARAIGMETSSRNSGVIHAGIYYPPDSLKARLCVAGRRALVQYCRKRGVPHRICGKLVVATMGPHITALESLYAQAVRNGVVDLEWLTPAQAQALEPAVRCVAALRSPSTGILDSHALLLALQADAERAGALFVFHSPVAGGEIVADGVALDIGDADPLRIIAHTVVNSAGLSAVQVACGLRGFPAALAPAYYYAKGNYFVLSGSSPFNGLIYPLPELAGLGVHVTLDLGGQARFGPDVEWVDRIDYHVDPARAERFYPAIRRYWPDLPDGALQPGYAGVRPKLQGPGRPTRADFMIQGPAAHGVAGLINLFGIESPGLTACLAIADYVASLAQAA